MGLSNRTIFIAEARFKYNLNADQVIEMLPNQIAFEGGKYGQPFRPTGEARQEFYQVAF